MANGLLSGKLMSGRPRTREFAIQGVLCVACLFVTHHLARQACKCLLMELDSHAFRQADRHACDRDAMCMGYSLAFQLWSLLFSHAHTDTFFVNKLL